MSSVIKAFLATLPLLVLMDLTWLGVVMKNFYQSRLATLLAPSVNWAPAVAFYLLFVAGLFYFVTTPNKGATFGAIFIAGALFGLVAYGTYDLTNQATLRDWPTTLTLVDILWGMFLSGVLAVVSGALLRYFGA